MQTSVSRLSLSGTALKRIACICMLIDHIGASCIEARFYEVWYASPYVVTIAQLDLVLRSIGRLAFPIYCFLLAEGFVHTHDVRRYAGRLLLFAVVSELPFDWAFFRTPFYWEHQNVYWTLLFGVAAMACLHWANPDAGVAPWRAPSGGEVPRRLAGLLGVVACAAVAEGMNTDYGAGGVLLIAVLYELRTSRSWQCVAGALVAAGQEAGTSIGLFAALAFVPVWFYNGQRGNCGRVQQWVFYVFYPAHLLILACITNLLL